VTLCPLSAIDRTFWLTWCVAITNLATELYARFNRRRKQEKTPAARGTTTETMIDITLPGGPFATQTSVRPQNRRNRRGTAGVTAGVMAGVAAGVEEGVTVAAVEVVGGVFTGTVLMVRSRTTDTPRYALVLSSPSPSPSLWCSLVRTFLV
jgi:hypothetical protein